MTETGRMIIVVDLVHTVFLKEEDTGKFTLVDGKMIRDMYVSMAFIEMFSYSQLQIDRVFLENNEKI